MRVLGWFLFAATIALFVLQGLLLAASNTPLISYEVLVNQVFPLLGIGAIVGAGVGALIISRYPRNLIGWLFVLGQLGNVIGLAAEAVVLLVRQGFVVSPQAARIAGYLSDVFGTVFAVTAISVVFMIAPDGRLLSRRWRFAVPVPAVALVLWWIGTATQSSNAYLPSATVDGEGLRESLTQQVFTLAGFVAMLVSVSLGAVALVLRTRRSTGQQRLQLRWISTGAASLAVTFVLFAITDILPTGTPWILPVSTSLAYIFFSVSVGVAIFRYRLYEIDVILSRAIVLAVLAVFVTIGYIVVVVAIGSVLAALGEPGSLYWPSLVATALVAAAFQPVRRHALRLADQLVYGSRAAPYEALATLSRRLADSPSPEAIPARVAEATGRAVGAAKIVVRLGDPEVPARVRTAVWPDPPAGGWEDGVGAPDLTVPVMDLTEQIGSIEVTMPPGAGLRTSDRRLLDDVAAQAVVAFRNALLEIELASRVAQTEAKSLELTASRRRLVGVQDEARERLAGAIQRRVVPHLAAVESELTALGSDQVVVSRLEPLINETSGALEELRAVCRGLFPALLERRGLIPALLAHLGTTENPTQLDIDDTADRRLDRAVEAASYLFCVEVAPADLSSVIHLRVEDDRLVATVTADTSWTEQIGDFQGVSTVDAWQNSLDRVAALDGEVSARRGEHDMSVAAVIPLGTHRDFEPR